MSGRPWTSLLALSRDLEAVPEAARREAGLLGARVESPTDHGAQVLHAFLRRYGRDLTPAGALVVDGAPSPSGAGRTGIPLTDERNARDALGLPVHGDATDPRCDGFWHELRATQRRLDAPWENLFANVHLVNACPFVLTDGTGAPVPADQVLPHAPALRDTSLDHLERVVRLLRPQVIVSVGRLAFEAVALLARNRHDLAASLAEGWTGVTAYAATHCGSGYRAEFPRFRARLIPVPDVSTGGDSETAARLVDLLTHAWT